MEDVKKPKKPLIFYYAIVLLVIVLFNALVMPGIREAQIMDVDYGTFMEMTEKKEIGEVEIQTNQILFTDKDGKTIFRTGLMDDPGRTERLYESGAVFSGEIIKEGSPVLMFLLSWILPLLMFWALGHFMSKMMMKKMGGGANSMMFGNGSAKVYV